MKQTCASCRYSDSGDDPCYRCVSFSAWEPKDDTIPKVRKPIFESEEEAREVYKIITDECPAVRSQRGCPYDEKDCFKCVLKDLKRAGLIRRDPVEEAEEMRELWKNATPDLLAFEVIEKLYQAIQHMKPYYEKYKEIGA